MKKTFFIIFFFVNQLFSQSERYLDLDLAQCIEIALENNLQLKRSMINQELQKIGYSQSILQQTPSLNLFSFSSIKSSISGIGLV